MNARERRLDLLRQCLDKLLGDEFQELVVLTLPVEVRGKLSQPVTRTSFLGDLEQLGEQYLDALEDTLRNREGWRKRLPGYLEELEELEGLRESVVIEESREEHVISVEEPREKPIVSLDFVNRVVELDEVFQSTLPAQYWIVDAPAGYGKSRFLQEIRRRYESKGWVCCYIEIPREKPSLDILGLANQIVSRLRCREPSERQFVAKRMGQQIAASISDLSVTVEEKTISLREAQYLGIALLLDNIEVLDDQTLSELGEFMAGVSEGLKNTGFLGRQNRLRFFLSGRSARRKASILLPTGMGGVQRALSPYSFPVVVETVRQYALGAGVVLPEENLPEIAAHLMHLTGGHPGCMSTILGKLAEERFAGAPSILWEDAESLCKDVVLPVLRKFEDEFDTPELISIMETLSVFRRYGPWLLQTLINKQHIHWDGDGYQLEFALVETYLMERKAGFLQDDITRRLFAIRLRHRDLPRFRRLCREGLIICEEYLHSKPRRSEIVAVEWLYQKLQYEYYVEEKRGNHLKQEILKATDYILDMLVATWDYREIIPDFREALNRDWEFEFVTNFFLSEKGYNHDLYRQLVEHTKAKSQQLRQGGDIK